MNINEFQEKREQIFTEAIESYKGKTFPYRATLLLVDDAGYYIAGVVSSDFLERFGLYYLDSTKTYHLGVLDDNKNIREIIAIQQAPDTFQLLPLFKELSEAREVADRIAISLEELQ